MTYNHDNLERNFSTNNKKENSSVDIRRYRDLEGLSVAKLDFGLWYVENKEKLQEFLFFIIFILGLLSWIFFFYQFGFYIFNGIPKDKILIKELLADNLPQYSYYTERKASDLQLYPVKTILGTSNKRDIIGQISNPNQDYWARFTYYFLNNNEEIGEKKGFILPNESKQLLMLGRDIPKSIGGLRLMIKEIKWGRVNPHYFGDWEKFKKDHLDFNFSNISFAPSESSSLTEKIALNSLSFYLENETNYNYWNVPLIISLYNYSDLISIATYEVNDFESSSSRNISFTWPGNFKKVTDIKIKADLDITRLDLYKEFKAPTRVFR